MNRDDLPSPLPPAATPPEVHHGLMARFRNYFLTGLIVAGPIAITFYLTWWFVTWVDGLVRPFVPIAYRPETYLPFGLPGSGLIVAVIALTLLGFLTANLIGRTLVDLGERLLGRMPVVRAIYRSLKQVFETLFSGKGSSFRRVRRFVTAWLASPRSIPRVTSMPFEARASRWCAWASFGERNKVCFRLAMASSIRPCESRFCAGFSPHTNAVKARMSGIRKNRARTIRNWEELSLHSDRQTVA